MDDLTEADRGTPHAIPLSDLFDLEAIRTALRRTLPEHMVPTGFVGLSHVPLTTSGKVDRKALPKADATLARASYEAPKGESEFVVAEDMTTLVGGDQVGRHDNFFALGGHSLMAVRLVARLEAETSKAITLKTVFEASMVAELAAALEILSTD
ncbi:MAG: phosphopantetheine-binding protein [Pseudomonadota bacterium]